jgi:RNA polymerase sigma-70 factor (ECF subfamily)
MALTKLINQLPEEKRQVFDLVSQMEMSIKHVAETLGIPEGTVKSRLHYARSWLSQEWQAQMDE